MQTSIQRSKGEAEINIRNPKERPISTLEVFHMYGPCSPKVGTSPMNMPSAQDILHRDRQRIKSLQARFKPNKYDSRFQDTKEAAHLPISSGDYAISISLGTPQQVQTLVFDTGSDITWTKEFHHYASTSLNIITCDRPLCYSLLPHHTCEMFNNIENTCYYESRYADGSYSKGAWSKDILNITQTVRMSKASKRSPDPKSMESLKLKKQEPSETSGENENAEPVPRFDTFRQKGHNSLIFDPNVLIQIVTES
ncbi:hypothetical protein CASFOL_038631 [Castilleja foliolosa]|uniref:Peptidase A1 domain-containing protein n=1 Tax=Castilleja foliolosa TaxID=1961234 RepID=A0ABD3BNN5_9LAMI